MLRVGNRRKRDVTAHLVEEEACRKSLALLRASRQIEWRYWQETLQATSLRQAAEHVSCQMGHAPMCAGCSVFRNPLARNHLRGTNPL